MEDQGLTQENYIAFGQKFITEPVMVGTLNPPGDKEVMCTFHGASAQRMGKNGLFIERNCKTTPRCPKYWGVSTQ